MTDDLHVLAGLVLAVLTVTRVGLLRSGTTSRSLWAVLATLAAAQALQVGPVYRAVEARLVAPGAASLAVHALTVLAACGTLHLVASLDSERAARRGRHLPLAAVTLAAMAGVYLSAVPAGVPAPLAHRAEFYAPTWQAAAGWALYLVYLGWALAGMIRTQFRYAAQAPAGPLRNGLLVGAAGITVGFGYIALKVAAEAAWVAGVGSHIVGVDAAAEAVVLSVCITLIGVSSAYEAMAVRLAGLRRRAAERRSLRRLEPLRRCLADTSEGRVDHLDVVGTRLRLVRSVVEIRDGQRVLRRYLPARTVTAARAAAARTAPHSGADTAALAEAVWMELGRRAQAVGAPARPSEAMAGDGGASLEEEVRLLERLAVQRHSPQVRRLADALHEHTPTTAVTSGAR